MPLVAAHLSPSASVVFGCSGCQHRTASALPSGYWLLHNLAHKGVALEAAMHRGADKEVVFVQRLRAEAPANVVTGTGLGNASASVNLPKALR
jgi:hypothetical protein